MSDFVSAAIILVIILAAVIRINKGIGWGCGEDPRSFCKRGKLPPDQRDEEQK